MIQLKRMSTDEAYDRVLDYQRKHIHIDMLQFPCKKKNRVKRQQAIKSSNKPKELHNNKKR